MQPSVLGDARGVIHQVEALGEGRHAGSVVVATP